MIIETAFLILLYQSSCFLSQHRLHVLSLGMYLIWSLDWFNLKPNVYSNFGHVNMLEVNKGWFTR